MAFWLLIEEFQNEVIMRNFHPPCVTLKIMLLIAK